jgi:NAD+ kinase
VELETHTADLVGGPPGGTVAELAARSDLLVVLGGDGTMLKVVMELPDAIPPIFGINLGTLGFLTCLGSADYLFAVETIVTGSYRLSQRTLLAVEVIRDGESIAKHRALNDAVISRGSLSRLIRLDVSIDDAPLTSYNADGLIVATPTGSTAYSLSAGGPVLAPHSGVFVITPICPHVLTNRSVIVGDKVTIEIAPTRDQDSVFLTLDGGNVVQVEAGDLIRLSKSPYELPLAMAPGMSFFEVLRQKLKWSGTAI